MSSSTSLLNVTRLMNADTIALACLVQIFQIFALWLQFLNPIKYFAQVAVSQWLVNWRTNCNAMTLLQELLHDYYRTSCTHLLPNLYRPIFLALDCLHSWNTPLPVHCA